MKYLLVIITLFVCVSCTNKYSSKYKDKDDLTGEDHIIINVFLEKFKSYTYLDLGIKHHSDSNSFLVSYQKKVKIYESFRKLCKENLSSTQKLNYETNFSCSSAEEFKIYKNLFSKDELEQYNNQLASKNVFNFLIDYKQILIPNIEPIMEKMPIDKKIKILKIYGIFYNNNRTKVLIKYSFNNKVLYQVLKKENNWWKNIINFDT
jgi:hypothetical protein